jgi:hypothetical protein
MQSRSTLLTEELRSQSKQEESYRKEGLTRGCWLASGDVGGLHVRRREERMSESERARARKARSMDEQCLRQTFLPDLIYQCVIMTGQEVHSRAHSTGAVLQNETKKKNFFFFLLLYLSE